MRRSSKHSCCNCSLQILVENIIIYHFSFIFRIGFQNQRLIYGTFKYVHLSTFPCTSSSITCIALTTTWEEKDICNPFFLMFLRPPFCYLFLKMAANDLRKKLMHKNSRELQDSKRVALAHCPYYIFASIIF